MKIVTVIGARPQIIKAAALSRAVRSYPKKVTEVIVHTGQHYDVNMSEVFIQELGIPQPDYNLNVGSGSHGKQTAAMIIGMEEILEKEKPDWLVVYGDTNSTLAAAIAAAKMQVPIAHIEAGLRSFNKSMPEEVNRILCDHVSTLLFSPTPTGYKNLIKEGFKENKAPFNSDNPGIYQCGDLMYDNSLYFSEVAKSKTSIFERVGLDQPFVLATIHRNANTDDLQRINRLFRVLGELSLEHNLRIILPIHPRTKKMMENLISPEVQEIIDKSQLEIIEPASFLEMIVLEQNAELVITDSGGVQKEAYYFQKPCIILRPETEWIELVENGCAKIADADATKIREAFNYYLEKKDELDFPEVFGDGKAAEFILNEMYIHSIH
ncbi:MAG: UDP-N-acetylglucosamine 2-epimerase (non-hydrolyzing) [Bacteroidia bacterium]